MFTASEGINQPIAIRYPRGRGEIVNWQQPFEKIEIGKSELLKKGTKIAVLSTGTIGNNVTKALGGIEEEALFSHYHFPFIKPLDEVAINEMIQSNEVLITIEDGVIKGGFGAQINSIIAAKNYTISILNLGIPDTFIEHGTVFEQQHFCKIDVQSLIQLFNTFLDD
jgi:1-deoxy-D-xylulose-5-phosphate synthase